ncbi:MAG: restriction endonuclease subunit S [Bacteroidetes bacterium]|nr:restriction endonuclease subunit S [Bacteroidota bacterium]
MKFGLEQHIIDTLIAVFEQHSKVDKALVFGSRAKGNYRPDSDIDIAIKGQDLNTDDIIAMSVAFEEKGITHKIDLINYHSIKEPELKDHIDRVGIEFYSRWQKVEIKDIIESANTGLDAIKRAPIVNFDTGIKCLRIQDVSQTKKYEDWGFCNVEERNFKRFQLKKEEIIIARTGATVGVNMFIENDLQSVFNNGLIRIRTNKNKCLPKFLHYTFRTTHFNSFIESISDGTSTQPNMQINALLTFEIALPPLKEQTHIANILTSLDNKIDLLNRQNKTLEQLAETLFRSYFPMTNEENKYVELGNYVDCIIGVSYKSSELNPSKVGMVSLKSFDRNGGFSIDGFKEFTGKFKEKQEVVEGDLIVAHTDITQDAEVIGNPALVIANPNFDTMTISMDIVKVISKVDWISIEFLYFLMKTREFKSHCEGCANGSTVLHLNKQAIPTFEFPEPDKINVAEFTKQAKEIVNKIFLNHRQLRNLVKTRDTLLPKLMSGEVRVNL